MRGQLPAPASGGLPPRSGRDAVGLRRPASAFSVACGRAAALALRRFPERGRPHRHALRVGSGKKKRLPRPFLSRRRLLAPAVSFCALTPPFARFALPHCALPTAAHFSTEVRPPASARAAADLGICGSLLRQGSGCRPPPSGAAPFSRNVRLQRRSRLRASCPGKDNRHVLFRTSTPRGGGANAHGLFFCLRPLSETVTRRPFCRGFTKRLRPSSGRNLRDMICGTQSGMRNHVPRARFTPYVQE